MRALIAVGLAMTLGTTPTTAQVARTHELTWPTAPIAPLPANHPAANSVTANARAANRPSTRIPQPLPAPQERVDDATFVSAILVSSLGSVAGLFGGAYAGIAMSNDGGELDYYAAFVGSAVGTSVGAVLPAGLISDNWGRAVLGSMGGVILGAMLGISVGEKFNGPMGVAVYGLTHGLLTTAATR